MNANQIISVANCLLTFSISSFLYWVYFCVFECMGECLIVYFMVCVFFTFYSFLFCIDHLPIFKYTKKKKLFKYITIEGFVLFHYLIQTKRNLKKIAFFSSFSVAFVSIFPFCFHFFVISLFIQLKSEQNKTKTNRIKKWNKLYDLRDDSLHV